MVKLDNIGVLIDWLGRLKDDDPVWLKVTIEDGENGRRLWLRSSAFELTWWALLIKTTPSFIIRHAYDSVYKDVNMCASTFLNWNEPEYVAVRNILSHCLYWHPEAISGTWLDPLLIDKPSKMLRTVRSDKLPQLKGQTHMIAPLLMFTSLSFSGVRVSTSKEMCVCSLDRAICELPRRMLLCKGCRRVKYCSENCQRNDWPQHRAYCRKVRAELSRSRVNEID